MVFNFKSDNNGPLIDSVVKDYNIKVSHVLSCFNCVSSMIMNKLANISQTTHINSSK